MSDDCMWVFVSTFLATWFGLMVFETRRKWVGLTDEEVESWRGNYDFFDSQLVREVEAKLKEKNGG